jgi:hypothetical protein
LEELARVVGRWHQLPLDHALSRMPSVRAVVQQLADAGAHQRGRTVAVVPQLGPEAVMDQLTVMVYDAFVTGPAEPSDVAGLLGSLRRSL